MKRGTSMLRRALSKNKGKERISHERHIFYSPPANNAITLLQVEKGLEQSESGWFRQSLSE